ncbi:MAG TPA: thioredoxin domain-containing protein [Acidiferrobacter sp.]|nr:thioredoxin domain-containing protein [Acidiferrobacter sp.]
MDATEHHTTANRLANETSPYLLQHAHNPVAWQPWDDTALRAARAQDKPILLSIGYSACHWCHVMAHESFEDPIVAKVMNDLYVCIKVDREERPDLDKIYQTAHNVLTRRAGGWPLTMFLDANDLAPFFAGTYFPKTERSGRAAFTNILINVEQYYRKHRADLAEQAPRLRAALVEQDSGAAHPGILDKTPLARAVDELKGQFDPIDGGFGGAPKFPHPTGIRRLLLTFSAGRDTEALEMAATSLRAMCDRGLYDHLEGGFFRYSVDRQWHIPHFEKMLYDNAQLVALYAEAFAATHEDRFREAAIASADWVIRDMQSPDGGYYSTLDADSEGEEGSFYLWQRPEFKALLDADEYAVAAPYFGMQETPNFEGHAYHLMITSPLLAISERLGLPLAEVKKRLDTARTKLTSVRATRTRPGRDDKILTAWNGLMIKAMARAGRLLDVPRFTESACAASRAIQKTLWNGQRLAAVTKDGRTSPYGYLDDYAFMLDGVLELLMTRWRDEDLAFAQALAYRLTHDFQDNARGGFYFTPEDHEALLYRPKPFADDALPSGNGIAAATLLRLSHLVGDPSLEVTAEAAVRAGSADLARYPSQYGALLEALEDTLDPPTIIILRGEGTALKSWHDLARAGFAPRRSVFAIPNAACNLPPGLAARAPRDLVVAYACHGLQCEAPITDERAFADLLKRTAGPFHLPTERTL